MVYNSQCFLSVLPQVNITERKRSLILPYEKDFQIYSRTVNKLAVLAMSA